MLLSYTSCTWSIFLYVLLTFSLKWLLRETRKLAHLEWVPKKDYACNKGQVQDVLLSIFLFHWLNLANVY